MIKNYKQFNESLRDLMVGPTEEEVLNSYKDLSPNDLLIKSSKHNFLRGIKLALDSGSDINIDNDNIKFEHNRNNPLLYASYWG